VIDYLLIADAVEYYQDNGYKLIDVPWTVPEDVIRITARQNINLENSKYLDKHLVGSAEQSFLHLMKTGKLTAGKYCAITPCFRDDDEDDTHQKYFMKLELIHVTSEWWKWSNSLETMIYDANNFFSLHVPTAVIKTNDARSDESYDIKSNNIELGSYGIRHHENTHWVYGTGLAEPRLSIVIDKNESINKVK